jgi:dinuclear metal center YbgI/SA1388 family protein
MATTSLTDLVTYLDGYLEVEVGKDSCPNGLQVEGRPEVRKLAAGVSACEELFVRAREQAADGVIVHHGLFWQGQSGVLTGVQYRRVAELIRGEMSLLAYHLPLDRHPVVGNNAVAARAFGLGDIEPFGDYEGQLIGFCGTFAEPVPTADFLERCKRIYGQEPLAFTNGPDPVSTVAIVSGAAAALLYEAVDRRIDLFLTGEPREWVMNVARETGTHFVAAGHYATERLGIQALGDHLQDHFGIEVDFIDIPNPV